MQRLCRKGRTGPVGSETLASSEFRTTSEIRTGACRPGAGAVGSPLQAAPFDPGQPRWGRRFRRRPSIRGSRGGVASSGEGLSTRGSRAGVASSGGALRSGAAAVGSPLQARACRPGAAALGSELQAGACRFRAPALGRFGLGPPTRIRGGARAGRFAGPRSAGGDRSSGRCCPPGPPDCRPRPACPR